MPDNDEPSATEAFEHALANAPPDAPDSKYVLCLYVSGATPKSVRAIDNIKAICEEYLHGRYELEVVDLFQQPDLAQREQIVAAPTLVKQLPPPLRRIIGDLSKTESVLVSLNLRPKQ